MSGKKRKSTIVDIEIETVSKEIIQLLKDYTKQQDKINEQVENMSTLYNNLENEYNKQNEIYDIEQGYVNEYEEKNGLVDEKPEEKEKDIEWSNLAIKADNVWERLNDISKKMNEIDSKLNEYESEFNTIDIIKKQLVEKYNEVNLKMRNKETHVKFPRKVIFGVNDRYVNNENVNNPVDIKYQEHLDEYGNPVFFEDLEGTTATDHDTVQGERMFYTSDKRNYNIEKAKRQDRIEKMREKLEEEQQKIEEELQNEEKIFGFPNKKRSYSSSQQSQPRAETLELQKLRKEAIKPIDEKKLGGSRVKELLKRTKNILKRVEKRLSKKKGTRKMKGGVEESSHPPLSPSLFELIPNIEVGKIFTVDEEGEYKVTKLALIDHGSKIIINSEKVGSVPPIKLNLVYNLDTHVVTEGRGIPSPSTPYMGRNNRELINLRRNEIAQFLGIDLSEARNVAIEEFAEKNLPEMSHPRRGGTRKHKKSKKKGTRKNKKRMK